MEIYYITYTPQFIRPISPLMSMVWSAPQTRVSTSVHTIAVLNKSVWANPDKDASFISPLFPFIPSAAVKENAINSKLMHQLHLESDKYFRGAENIFKPHSRLPPSCEIMILLSPFRDNQWLLLSLLLLLSLVVEWYKMKCKHVCVCVCIMNAQDVARCEHH